LTERQPWTPKGIWGHKDPAEMTLEEKEQMLEKAKYSGPLTTAYWENEIAGHKFKPDREEAESLRRRVQELEEENKKLKAEINRPVEISQGAGPAETESEQTEMNQALLQTNKEELKEKKKGIGQRFKEGVVIESEALERPADGLATKEPVPETGSAEKPAENAAEVHPDDRDRQIEELRRKIKDLREERYKRSRATGVIGQTKIEEEYAPQIKELENRIKELERGEKSKITGRGVAGFFAERAKGFLGGFGWWEAHQAEKFRLGTKETGQQLNAEAMLLQQEEGLLDLNAAWEEAQETEAQREETEKELLEIGIEEKDARHLAVETISDQISGKKKERNRQLEDEMVAGALAKLEEELKKKSRVQEYMAAHGGKVITLEKMREVEKRIREEIGKLRKGQVKKDFVDFVKLSRQSLDRKWWTRYVYTGLDAVLAGLMVKWIAGKYLGTGVEKAAEAIGGGGVSGAEQTLEIAMKDTVWGETKRFLIERGLTSPGDADILKYARMVAEDSSVAVKEWGLEGQILDKQMPGGYLLKFGRVAAELAKLGL
ncbi:MAG: hypothetical protein Q8R34_01110, partial [bacterium]|nr:hypothetical protein [bacterium]